jgi:hypothetical protein
VLVGWLHLCKSQAHGWRTLLARSRLRGSGRVQACTQRGDACLCRAFTYEDSEGSISNAISQPFASAGNALSGMGKLAVKGLNIIPGIGKHDNESTAGSGKSGKRKSKRSKLKNLFKSKKEE